MKAVVLLSGGLDSTTLLYLLKGQCDEVKALTIVYGQKHVREVIAAGQTCKKLGVEWLLLNFTDLKKVVGESALVSKNAEVPEGSYTDETMKQTVVPNRNMILLSVAAAWASTLKFDIIAYAAHAGDHTIYPDCRKPFFTSAETTINIGNWLDKPMKVLVPFSDMPKTDILKLGISIGADYSLTWTCYKGDLRPCGKCGACVERAEAFRVAGFKDPLLEEVIA